MPQAGALPIANTVLGAIGLGSSLLGNRESSAERAANERESQAAQAQAAEIKRRTELSNMLQQRFSKRMGTGQGAGNLEELLAAYGMDSLKDLPGAQNYGDLQAYGRLNRGAMARNLMGLTGPVGSDVLSQQGQQGFLEDAQGHQDITESASALADSMIGLFESKQQEVQPTIGVDEIGSANGARYADSLATDTDYVGKF